MRGNMLKAGLIACGLMVISPIVATASARLPLAWPGAQPHSGETMLSDEMEYFTIPLGPYRMTPWPFDFCGAFVPARELEKAGP